MSLRDDIAQRIHEQDCGCGEGSAHRHMSLAAAVMPLVRRAQAEATAQRLRALSEKYENFGKREADPMMKVTYKTAAAFMSAEAVHIENEFKEADR